MSFFFSLRSASAQGSAHAVHVAVLGVAPRMADPIGLARLRKGQRAYSDGRDGEHDAQEFAGLMCHFHLSSPYQCEPRAIRPVSTQLAALVGKRCFLGNSEADNSFEALNHIARAGAAVRVRGDRSIESHPRQRLLA
jgi:hypothetical protein